MNTEMTIDRLIRKGYKYSDKIIAGLVLVYVNAHIIDEAEEYPRASQLNNQRPKPRSSGRLRTKRYKRRGVLLSCDHGIPLSKRCLSCEREIYELSR